MPRLWAQTRGAASEEVVVASDKNDECTDFSNYSPSGRCADIFAPGVNIFSTCRETGIYSRPYCGIPELGQPEGGMHSAIGYTFSDGTSMASPHAAGVAALPRSLYPEKSAAEIKA